MRETSSKAFQEMILPRWGEKEEANRAAVGVGWEIAVDFAALHEEAVRLLSTAAGASPSKSDQASILLSLHGFHLFLESTALVIRGQFDVVTHLLRGLRDLQSLLLVCAFDGSQAEKFLQSKMKASEARRLEVEVLRNHDEALGDEFDQLLSEETKYAHILAHVNPVHLYKAVEIDGGKLTPVLRGKVDSEEANDLLKAVLRSEAKSLSVMRDSRTTIIGDDWTQRLSDADEKLGTYMKSDSAERDRGAKTEWNER